MNSVVEASIGPINRGWAVSFVLAILTLIIVWFAVPNTKELVVGKDGRWSTSKFQAIAWTLVVLFALFSLFWAYAMAQFGNLVDWKMLEHLQKPLGESFNSFFASKFDSTYLVLLGLPLGTAVASKAITTTKIANGTEVKPPKEGENTTAVQELVGKRPGGNRADGLPVPALQPAGDRLLSGLFHVAPRGGPAEHARHLDRPDGCGGRGLHREKEPLQGTADFARGHPPFGKGR